MGTAHRSHSNVLFFDSYPHFSAKALTSEENFFIIDTEVASIHFGGCPRANFQRGLVFPLRMGVM